MTGLPDEDDIQAEGLRGLTLVVVGGQERRAKGGLFVRTLVSK